MNLVAVPHPPLMHLKRLTTSRGLYEHALFSEARPEHGYCVDDAARAIVLLCREPRLDTVSRRLLDIYLGFTLTAISVNGTCHNRMNVDGNWSDEPGDGDWWGRAIWALGYAAVHAPEEEQRSRALAGFRSLAQTTTPHLMAFSFAVLGAGELFLYRPNEKAAKQILQNAQPRYLPVPGFSDWWWPEPRLRYSNGSVAEAALLTGWALRDPEIFDQGIRMLDFLLAVETKMGHFSVTPIGGRGPGDTETEFDQQPIEVAAIADACARAWAITGHSRWLIEVKRAWNWFLGDNDVGIPMFDPDTGAGYDGLHAHGPNRNQGAESTIAMLSTAQHAFRLGVAP